MVGTVNLAELFPYERREFTMTDGATFHGWLAEAGSASVPGLAAMYETTGMSLWTQDVGNMPPTGLIGGVVTDTGTGTRYLIAEATHYTDPIEGGLDYWLLNVKENRGSR